MPVAAVPAPDFPLLKAFTTFFCVSSAFPSALFNAFSKASTPPFPRIFIASETVISPFAMPSAQSFEICSPSYPDLVKASSNSIRLLSIVLASDTLPAFEIIP